MSDSLPDACCAPAMAACKCQATLLKAAAHFLIAHSCAKFHARGYVMLKL
jgi:hypothetical protein